MCGLKSADAGDNRPLRTLAEVRVGRADIAVHNRGHDGSLCKLAMQPVPNLGHVREVAFQLSPAALQRSAQHVESSSTRRSELLRGILADEPRESGHRARQLLQPLGCIEKADQRRAALGHVGMLQPAREVPTREPAIHGEEPPIALSRFEDQWQLQADVASQPSSDRGPAAVRRSGAAPRAGSGRAAALVHDQVANTSLSPPEPSS